MIARDGRKRWKPIDAGRMALLISVYTITLGVRANASKKYIHRENR
jgi:hypothetical protein